MLVGEPARREVVVNPQGTAAAFKRKMGQRIKLKLRDREFTPVQQGIAAQFAERLRLGGAIADSCMGVKDIVNNVRVLRRRPEGADDELSGPGRPEGAPSDAATPRAPTATAKGTLDISQNPRSK